MLRRSVLTAAVTVILVIGGGALAYALWSVQEPLPDVQITTSEFDASAAWVDEPVLTTLFPGDTASGTAVVRLESSATWEYSVDLVVDEPLAGHLTATWQPGCDGPPLPTGTPSGTPLPGGATSEFCLEFTLAGDAPSELQGATSDVEVVVTVEQVTS